MTYVEALYTGANGITVGWAKERGSIHVYSPCCAEEIHWTGDPHKPDWRCSKCETYFEWAKGNKNSGTWTFSNDELTYLVSVWCQLDPDLISIKVERS